MTMDRKGSTHVEGAARVAFFLGLVLIAASCRHAALAQDPVSPTPIELAPRCLEVEGAPPLEPAVPDDASFARTVPRLVPWSLGESVRGGFLEIPHAAFDAIQLGLPLDPGDEGGFRTKLAAAALAEGLLSSDPVAFRGGLALAGGRLSALVHGDRLWLEMQFPPDRREQALARFSEWLDPRLIDREALARIHRKTRLLALAESSSPTFVAGQAFDRLLGVGTASVVAAKERPVRPEDLRDFVLDRIGREDSIVVYSGHAVPDDTPDLGRRIGSILGEARTRALRLASRSAPRSEPERRPPIDSAPGTIHLVDRPGAPQVEFLVGFSTPTRDGATRVALESLASLLGGNVGGRLFRDLRERQGLAYIIDAAQASTGRFVVTTRSRPERVAALLLGIEAHLRALSEIPISDCEAEMLRDRMLGEYAIVLDEPDALRALLREEIAPRTAHTAHAALPDLAARLARLAMLDVEKLREVASRRLRGAPTVVLVGDADRLERSLGEALPGRPIRVFEDGLDSLR